jgi:hypothetical protein
MIEQHGATDGDAGVVAPISNFSPVMVDPRGRGAPGGVPAAEVLLPCAILGVGWSASPPAPW